MGWLDSVSSMMGESSGFVYGDTRSHSKRTSSRASVGPSSGRSSSFYKRSPRKGYMNLAYKKLRRMIQDLIYYIKTNPMKVVMLVIVPLISGGLLTTFLARFGIRLPPTIQKMLAQLGGHASSFESSFGGRGGSASYRRDSYRSSNGGSGGFGGQVANIVGGLGGLGTALSMAKMFM